VGSGKQGGGGAHGGQVEKCAEWKLRGKRGFHFFFSPIYFAVSLPDLKPEQEEGSGQYTVTFAWEIGTRRTNKIKRSEEGSKKKDKIVGSVKQWRWNTGWRKSYCLLQSEHV
jgi:hypothetical protein